MTPKMLKCYLVDRDYSGHVTAGVAERSMDELPEGDVLIRVAFSSLNYKDAMAATGHSGIVKRFPHVPGVDAAGHRRGQRRLGICRPATRFSSPVLTAGPRAGAVGPSSSACRTRGSCGCPKA